MRCSRAVLAVMFLLPPAVAAAQVKPCDELRQEIDRRLQEKGIRGYQLTVAPADERTPLTVVGRCEGGTRQILYERLGVADRQPEPAPHLASASGPAAEAPAPPPAPARPASVPEPRPAPPAPPTPANEEAVVEIAAIDGTAGIRIPRGDLARVQALSIAAGTASADASLETFVQRTRMGLLPDLRGDGREPGEFILVETDQRVGSQTSSLILQDGRGILAEAVSEVRGLLPERHDGLHDLCVAIRDVPAPGVLDSYWVFAFTGGRYARRERAFGTNTCDGRVVTPIVRR